jgi:CarD family transcriptional regulator
MQFKVGDNAVYPTHGVALIDRIENRQIDGKDQSFYILKMLETGMKVMVPTDKAKSVGLRQVISKYSVTKVINILKHKNSKVDHQTWNRRYRQYMEKIKTGNVYEIAEVLRDLYQLKTDKELSFGERKMLDTAKSFLIKELSIAKQRNEKDVEDEIAGIFKSTLPPSPPESAGMC